MCKSCIEDLKSNLEYDTVIATAEIDGVSNNYWKGFNTFFAKGKNLGEKQHYVFEKLLNNYNSVVLIGIDIPQLSTKFIINAFRYLENNNYVLGPSSDGGFYLFGSKSKIDKEVWAKTEWSSSRTLETFVRSLNPKPYIIKEFSDVDDYQDLNKMIQEMPAFPSEKQLRLINWVKSIDEFIK